MWSVLLQSQWYTGFEKGILFPPCLLGSGHMISCSSAAKLQAFVFAALSAPSTFSSPSYAYVCLWAYAQLLSCV